MKINLIKIIGISLVCIGCSKDCKTDYNFEKFYYRKLRLMIEYDNYTLTGDSINSDLWMNFYYHTTYLHLLTGHQFRYDATEPPGYASENDLNLDIKELENWYNKNKCGMTIKKADSIVNVRRWE